MLQQLLDRFVNHNDIVIDNEIYMRRYFLTPTRTRRIKNWPQLRIHHIRLADAGRELHDHPFDFVSFILNGAYIEERPDTMRLRRRFSIGFRRAKDLHRITETYGNVWTLVLVSRIKRRWGFVVDGVWTPNKVVSEGRAVITPTVKG